eukprot:31074-Pelagococcus_subviridis.AAC.6
MTGVLLRARACRSAPPPRDARCVLTRFTIAVRRSLRSTPLLPAPLAPPAAAAAAAVLRIHDPREARLEVRQHQLQRHRPPLVPVEREPDLHPVHLVSVCGARGGVERRQVEELKGVEVCRGRGLKARDPGRRDAPPGWKSKSSRIGVRASRERGRTGTGVRRNTTRLWCRAARTAASRRSSRRTPRSAPRTLSGTL